MEKPVEVPKTAPILSVKGGVLFPNLVMPLILTDEESQKLVDDVLKKDRLCVAVTQKDQEKEKAGPQDLYSIGTLSTVMKMLRIPDGTMRVLVQGITRVRIKEFIQREPYLIAEIEELEEFAEEDVEIDALKHNVLSNFKEVVSNSPFLPDELAVVALSIKEAGKLADFVASYMNFPVEVKQKILETVGVKERLKLVLDHLVKELQVIRVSQEIQEKVKSEMDKGQREYILREQLKAIQKELGILDEKEKEAKELREKIETKNLPKYVKEVALKEVEKLARVMTGSPEYTVIRNYLDWILAIPWNEETEDNLDIKRAKKILDEDHYNLEKVKERILEFLAVRKLKKDTKGPILCFVGPPGVGKTSLGKSIAKSLGRKFVRMSLGGIRDEAEIRGHRRTYVGALPGRIIQGIKQAGSKNPVFMLDEIDKVGMDFRGDPAAALLEVLDPEQNHAFVDHYLDLPFDLSSVLFIATANVTQTIPPALLDRMEVIELPGYITEEKVEIAKGYIIPRQKIENGLGDFDIKFWDTTLVKIIQGYTREAGVRNLERQIASIMRKIAKEVAMDKIKNKKIVITPKTVEKYLGPPIYYEEVKARRGEIGVVTGLAWTPSGGEILFVESLKMPGGKNLILTGQLGDVMKESCEAALSLVRARAEKLSIDSKFYDKYDIHIHVPEGAIPKDGPSAGIAIFTSLVSLLKEIPVNPEIAMTGEITLSGRILPVGGIKEKVMAAKRAGIKKVVLPEWNEKDLKDIPDHIKKNLKFYFVNNVDQILDIVFKGKKEKND